MIRRDSARVRLSRSFAIVVLILDILGTAWGWYITRQYEKDRDTARFQNQVDRAKIAIAKRMLDHELILRSAHGLFAASHYVERNEFAKFVAALRLEENFPGIQGVGFSKIIPRDKLAAHTAAIRAEGFPKYRVWPEGDRDLYTAIVYLEPFVKRNLRAFGYDMWTEPTRRAALTIARDSGVATISGKVRLVQETETEVQQGILMYVPVFRGETHSETIEDRRKAINGWVYSPFRMKDLMSGILGHTVPDIVLSVYDLESVDPNSLLYSSDPENSQSEVAEPDGLRTVTKIDVYGRTWTLCFCSLPSFFSQSSSRGSNFVLIVGIGITLFLAIHLMYENVQSARLAKSEAKLRSFIDESHDAIISMSHEGRVLEWNPAAERAFGWSRAEVLGRPLADLIIPEQVRPAHNKGLALFLETGQGPVLNKSIELEGLHRSGCIVPVEITISAVKNQASWVFNAIARDISDRRSVEAREKEMIARMMQMEKMTTLGTLVAGIAHELNNPLTGIMGYAELLRNATNAKELDRDLAALSGEAERCSRIVKNLLTFARQAPPHREPCQINKIIRELMAVIDYQFRTSDIDTELQLDPDLPILNLDAPLLRQVLLNIAKNAFDAMKEIPGPHLMIVRTSRGRDTVSISIQDSGAGIKRQHIDKIFDPFFTTKEVGKGTGLGLSLCHGIIADHGGTIQVGSVEGGGATITIALPIANGLLTTAEPEPAKSAAAPGSPAHPRILLIDDEPSVIKTTGRWLVSEAYEVRTAMSADEALGILKTESFDVIVCDLKMPRTSGDVVLRAVIAEKPEMRERFIISTGDVISMDARALAKETGARLLEKPYKLGELKSLIDEIVKTAGVT